jgi:type IV pilus biogenesis protein CpaD/CtpE
MNIERAFASAAAIAMLSGCATYGSVGEGMIDNEQFGEANRQTMAAQIIDPDPQYDTLVPETSAEHAAQAIERYRTDKVKKPERIRSTESVSGSGGSGGSN